MTAVVNFLKEYTDLLSGWTLSNGADWSDGPGPIAFNTYGTNNGKLIAYDNSIHLHKNSGAVQRTVDFTSNTLIRSFIHVNSFKSKVSFEFLSGDTLRGAFRFNDDSYERVSLYNSVSHSSVTRYDSRHSGGYFVTYLLYEPATLTLTAFLSGIDAAQNYPVKIGSITFSAQPDTFQIKLIDSYAALDEIGVTAPYVVTWGNNRSANTPFYRVFPVFQGWSEYIYNENQRLPINMVGSSWDDVKSMQPEVIIFGPPAVSWATEQTYMDEARGLGIKIVIIEDWENTPDSSREAYATGKDDVRFIDTSTYFPTTYLTDTEAKALAVTVAPQIIGWP